MMGSLLVLLSMVYVVLSLNSRQHNSFACYDCDAKLELYLIQIYFVKASYVEQLSFCLKLNVAVPFN